MNIEMFENVIKYVDKGFWILLLVCILIAFLRGLKGNFNHLMGTIIVVTACVFLSDVVTKSLIDVNIAKIIGSSDTVTIRTLIENAIKDNLGIAIEEGSKLAELASSMAIAFGRVIVYILMLIVGLLIFRPIIGLIVRFTVPIPKTKSFLSRLGGVGLELISFTLVFFFGLGLLFGVEGLIQDAIEYSDMVPALSNDSTEHEELSEEERENALDTVKVYIDIIESKPTFKIISMVSGHNHKIETKFLGYMSRIKTSYGTLNLVSEKEAYLPLVPIFSNMDTNDPTSIINIVTLNRETIIKSLKASNIFDFSMPIAVEVLEAKKPDLAIPYDVLHNINWKNEKNSLFNILDELLQIVEEANFDYNEPKNILKDEHLDQYLKRLGAKLNESGIIKDVLLPLANDLLLPKIRESVPADFSDLINLIDFTKLDLENDFYYIGKILKVISSMGILDEGNEFNLIANKEEIGNLLEYAFSQSLVIGNEKTIFTTIINHFELEEKLDSINLKFNVDDVTNWQQEIQRFKRIIVNLLTLLEDLGVENFDDIDISDSLKESINSDIFKTIVSDICQSELVNQSIIPLIHSLLTQMNITEWESAYFKAILDGDEIVSGSELETNILILLEIAEEAMSLDLENLNLETAPLDEIKELIKKMNSSTLFTISPIVNYISNMLESLEYDITLIDIADRNNNGSNIDEWDVEIDLLFEILSKLNNLGTLGDNTLNENATLFGEILNLMKQSYLFGNDVRCDGLETTDDNIFNEFMIISLTKLKLIDGEHGFIELSDAQVADWTKYDYEVEFGILSNYNTELNLDEQGDDLLKTLLDSEIIQDFFDISSIFNDKLSELTINKFDENIKLSDFINDGNPIDAEYLAGRNFGDEIDALNKIIDAFDNDEITDDAFKDLINDLSSSEKDTIAKEAASNIKDYLIEQGKWN